MYNKIYINPMKYLLLWMSDLNEINSVLDEYNNFNEKLFIVILSILIYIKLNLKWKAVKGLEFVQLILEIFCLLWPLKSLRRSLIKKIFEFLLKAGQF